MNIKFPFQCMSLDLNTTKLQKRWDFLSEQSKVEYFLLASVYKKYLKITNNKNDKKNMTRRIDYFTICLILVSINQGPLFVI